MKWTPTKIAASGATIVLAIVALWLIFKDRKQLPRQRANVNPANLNPSTNYSTIATNLFNAFDGVDWFGTRQQEKEDAVNMHLNLNQDEFKEVYNRYNELFATAPETLKTHFNGETFSNRPLYDQYIGRFNQLQLP